MRLITNIDPWNSYISIAHKTDDMPEDINIAHIDEYPRLSHDVNWVSHRGKGNYYIDSALVRCCESIESVLYEERFWWLQEGRTYFARAGEVACHWWSSPVWSECLSFTNNDSLILLLLLLLCATTSRKSRELPRTEHVLLIRLSRLFLSAVVMPSQPHGESSGAPPALSRTSVSWHL